MLGKAKPQKQRDLFNPMLIDFIDKKHELVNLAEQYDWRGLESELAQYYPTRGRASMPVRFMAGCMILKHLYNLGDETLVQAWIMNPYMQYFTGESTFQHSFPCDPSDFVHFRHRMGEQGMQAIFKKSVEIHGGQAFNSEVSLSDTTVQENNTTYPTDAKLYKKVIDACNKIAKSEKCKQRQTYKRVSKKLVRNTHNFNHPRRYKKAKKSVQKLKTLSGRLVRELRRELDPAQLSKYEEKLRLFEKIIHQQRHDKDKIYSLHKPYTACIAKGKAHKKYEFGNKVGILTNAKNLIIQAVETYKGNPHDSKTIEPLIDQVQENFQFKPKEITYDRGGRGANQIQGVHINTPKPPKKTDTAYQKRKARQKHKRRAAIEPVIGHLKSQFRMAQNYLLGEETTKMNALLAATAWNLKKWMRNQTKNFLYRIFRLTYKLNFCYLLPQKIKF